MEISLGAFRALVEHAIVNFEYIKLDGSVREATGSRNIELLRKNGTTVDWAPKGGKPNPRAYWDITRRNWRSFSELENVAINVISWTTDRGTNPIFVPKNSQLPKSSEPAPRKY